MVNTYIKSFIKEKWDQHNYYELNEFVLMENGNELDPVFETLIDVIDSVKNPEVIGRMSLIDIFDFIKRGHLFYPESVKKIISLRNNPKGQQKYDEIKTSMPACCYNACFHNYKKLENIYYITNLMFLDVDGFGSREDALEYKNTIIKKYDWIIACYESISRTGLHIVIKVDRILDNQDFNEKYEYINKTYFSDRLDKYAKSLTRSAVISNDTDIYINLTPSTLILNDKKDIFKKIIIDKNEDKKSTTESIEEKIIKSYYTFLEIENDAADDFIEEKKAIYRFLRLIRLKFKVELNPDLFDDPNEPLYNWSGWDVAELNIYPYLKKKIHEGNRTYVLGKVAQILIYLNGMRPEMKNQIVKFIHHFNNRFCSPPLSYIEVKKSFDYNWNKFIKGEMDFSSVIKKKRSIWSPECQLNRQEKISKSLVLYHKPLKEKKKNKILEALNSIHENNNKITQKEVALITGFSIATIKNYWKLFPEIKERVNELNLSLKRLKL